MRVKLGCVFLATTLTVAAFCLLLVYANVIFDHREFWAYAPARLYLYLSLGLLIGGLTLSAIIGNLLVGQPQRLIRYIGIIALLGGGLLINLILIVVALIRHRAKLARFLVDGDQAGSGLFANALAADCSCSWAQSFLAFTGLAYARRGRLKPGAKKI